MTGLQAATGLPIANIRIGIEVTVVAIGWYLGGIVGAGTMIFAFGVGPCVAIGILLVKTVSLVSVAYNAAYGRLHSTHSII